MKKLLPLWSLAVAVAALPALTSANDGFEVSKYLVELDDHVNELGLPAYANDWWQWAYSMPQDTSPIHDTNGQNCDVNQQGPVWYLAGGFGSSKISRKCRIPANKHIFFPVINMVQFTPPGTNRTCAEVKASAAENNSRFVFLRVQVNGSKLKDAQRFRVASQQCFDLFGRVPSSYNPPSYAPSATDGYWIMLHPLPPGQHLLEFSAFYTNPDQGYGDMVQNISYNLTVVD